MKYIYIFFLHLFCYHIRCIVFISQYLSKGLQEELTLPKKNFNPLLGSKLVHFHLYTGYNYFRKHITYCCLCLDIKYNLRGYLEFGQAPGVGDG